MGRRSLRRPPLLRLRLKSAFVTAAGQGGLAHLLDQRVVGALSLGCVLGQERQVGHAGLVVDFFGLARVSQELGGRAT